jgi:hypothetical protein
LNFKGLVDWVMQFSISDRKKEENTEACAAWCAIVMDRDDVCGPGWLEDDNELHGGQTLPTASSSTAPMLSTPLICCCSKMDAVAVD